MALKLVNKQISTMETSLNQISQNSMRTQVANSKGTEWMVSSYQAWQQRSPIGNEPQRSNSSVMRMVSRMTQKERQLNGVFALSYRVLVFMLGLILMAKNL